jgi:hypothetical protein
MFDIRQSVLDKHGEQDEGRIHKYIDGLMEEFAKAPEAQPIIEQEGNVGWAASMLEFYFGYIGGEFAEVSVADFDEVLFEIFPRKMSTEPEKAPAIVAELRAFWSFVQRQYGLPSAGRILATLTDRTTARLQQDLADPSKWGMAKSFFMRGTEAGYDMTSQAGLDEFMREYNARLLSGQAPPLPLGPPEPDWGEEDDFVPLPPSPLSHEERKKKRKERKRQRQARKRKRK